VIDIVINYVKEIVIEYWPYVLGGLIGWGFAEFMWDLFSMDTFWD